MLLNKQTIQKTKMMMKNQTSNHQGFTLVELMMVIAIIGILAAVAIPSYQNYVQRGFRGDAIADLEKVMSAANQFYTENRTYTATIGSGGLGFPGGTSFKTREDRYAITLGLCDNPANPGNSLTIAQCVEATANPSSVQAFDGILRVNTLGLKTRTQTINGSQVVHEGF